MTHAEWLMYFKRFGSLPFNYYRSDFKPYEIDLEDQELGMGDSAELWEWQQNFVWHWGRHAASALYALHTYIVDHEILK